MDIITNNIDRREYKIRIHKGIILERINKKIHQELKRVYSKKKVK